MPLAIAAPTPVSSLVHSSTLVTAGVYLMIRFNFFLVELKGLIILVGLLTMFLGGLVALVERDFKKVVAISTLRQLGFIVFSVSQGFWLLTYLHILFHALFKSLLFLSTGGLIHGLLGVQDRRFYGRVFRPFSIIFFNVRVFRLIGFPFLLGFYSKDRILGGLFSFTGMTSFLFIVCCCLTVCYSLRLLVMRYFIFPTFFSFVSMKNDLVFFLSVFVIYAFCWVMGNFIFYNFFLFRELFSFIDYFVGVFVIISGLLIYLFFDLSYYFLYFSMKMRFLRRIFSGSLFFFFNSLRLNNLDIT